jgi:hypothetical protein
MKSTFRKGLMLTALLALAWGPSAWAACTLDTQAVYHSFGLAIENCPDANPVTGYIYALLNPAINSGTQSALMVCEEGGVPGGIGSDCFSFAGIAGDGIVTVLYDFGLGNQGSVGCPNPTQGPEAPVVAQVLCNNGASAMLAVGFDPGSQFYALDYAHPGFANVQAGFENGPSLTSFGAGPSPSADTVCVNVPGPTVHSDCDPVALGFDYTCPSGSVRPPIGRGQLYTREAACGSSPDPRVASGWSLTGLTQPDTAGDACNLITRPTTLAKVCVGGTNPGTSCTSNANCLGGVCAGQCAFLGATARIGTPPGTETAALVGWLQIAGPAASNDKVKIDNAAFAQGRLVVDFSTTNETSIVGFNVYSGANKLNGSLINAKGAGSNAYTFEVGRGALKGGKSVLVEAVKSDGSVEKTAPVTLK